MEFQEVASSKFRPFSDYLSVKRAKELGCIPERYNDVFLDRCLCGSERMVRISSGSITGITCCDHHCMYKLIFQLVSIFERFGYKGIGKETCAKVVQDFTERGNPFSIADIILDCEKVMTLSGVGRDRWIDGIEHIKSSRQTFGSLLYKLSFPGIGSKFEDVMQGISSINDLASAVEKEGFFGFFGRREVKSFTTIYYFVKYLPDIYILSEFLKETIIPSCDKVLPICMTGRMNTVVGKFTKANYLALCTQYLSQRELEEKFELKAINRVTDATFVIAGEDSVVGMSGKYRQALEKQAVLRNLKTDPEYRIVFSPDEFLSMMIGRGDESG